MAHHRHQLEAIHSQALQVIQAVDNAVEGVIELFDMQLINDEVQTSSFMSCISNSSITPSTALSTAWITCKAWE